MKKIKETLYENKQERYNLDDLAYEFITDVLKLGTRDNLIDKFLSKKKIDKRYAIDLLGAVVKRLQAKWL